MAKNKERIDALELENAALKDRISKLEGQMFGLQILVDQYRRSSQPSPAPSVPWQYPRTQPFIYTPKTSYISPTIWKIDG